MFDRDLRASVRPYDMHIRRWDARNWAIQLTVELQLFLLYRRLRLRGCRSTN